jgi:hypothetical protein
MGDPPAPNNKYIRIDLDQAADAPVQERRGSGPIRVVDVAAEAGSVLACQDQPIGCRALGRQGPRAVRRSQAQPTAQEPGGGRST